MSLEAGAIIGLKALELAGAVKPPEAKSLSSATASPEGGVIDNTGKVVDFNSPFTVRTADGKTVPLSISSISMEATSPPITPQEGLQTDTIPFPLYTVSLESVGNIDLTKYADPNSSEYQKIANDPEYQNLLTAHDNFISYLAQKFNYAVGDFQIEPVPYRTTAGKVVMAAIDSHVDNSGNPDVYFIYAVEAGGDGQSKVTCGVIPVPPELRGKMRVGIVSADKDRLEPAVLDANDKIISIIYEANPDMSKNKTSTPPPPLRQDNTTLVSYVMSADGSVNLIDNPSSSHAPNMETAKFELKTTGKDITTVVINGKEYPISMLQGADIFPFKGDAVTPTWGITNRHIERLGIAGENDLAVTGIIVDADQAQVIAKDPRTQKDVSLMLDRVYMLVPVNGAYVKVRFNRLDLSKIPGGDKFSLSWSNDGRAINGVKEPDAWKTISPMLPPSTGIEQGIAEVLNPVSPSPSFENFVKNTLNGGVGYEALVEQLYAYRALYPKNLSQLEKLTPNQNGEWLDVTGLASVTVPKSLTQSQTTDTSPALPAGWQGLSLASNSGMSDAKRVFHTPALLLKDAPRKLRI